MKPSWGSLRPSIETMNKFLRPAVCANGRSKYRSFTTFKVAVAGVFLWSCSNDSQQKLFAPTAAFCRPTNKVDVIGSSKNPEERFHTMINKEEEFVEDSDVEWHLKGGRFKLMAISQINANETLEDRAVLQEVQTPKNGTLLFAAVMDGHGGWQVAEYVQRKLGGFILMEIVAMSAEAKLSDEEIAEAMRRAFVRLDNSIMQKVKGTCSLGMSRNSKVGACCVAALVTDTSVIVANAGDCRAVMDVNGSCSSLSDSHSANEKTEQAKLRKEHPGEDDIFVCKSSFEVQRSPSRWVDFPVFWLGFLGKEIQQASCYVKGRLQPTRSFGDFYLKRKEFSYDYETDRPFVKRAESFPYITAEPETKIVARKKGVDSFLLLASDGVWDFLTPQESIDVARKHLKQSPEAAASGVIEAVLRKASGMSGIGFAEMALLPPKHKRRVFDDTTVCIVRL